MMRRSELRRKASGIVVGVLLATFIPQMSIAELLEDGEFLNWTDTYLGDGGWMTWYAQGGNPGAHIESMTYSGRAMHLMICEDVTWDPNTQGTVESVLVEIDVKSVSGWGQGQGIWIILLQDDQYFAWYCCITGSATSWHTMSMGSCAQDDFGLVTGACTVDPNCHPDFSADASPIMFGFGTSNGSSGYYTQKYDNWRLFINDHWYGVPDPPDDSTSGDQGEISGSSHDPVNTATGNLFHQETDLSAPTRGGLMAFTRYYNSAAAPARSRQPSAVSGQSFSAAPQSPPNIGPPRSTDQSPERERGACATAVTVSLALAGVSGLGLACWLVQRRATWRRRAAPATQLVTRSSPARTCPPPGGTHTGRRSRA